MTQTLPDLWEEPEPDTEEAPAKRGRVQPIDWATFLTRDVVEVDWLPGQLLARGQQAALVGKGKAGKSLFALEWAWRAAAGMPFLLSGERPPASVLYVDRENSDDDIRERLLSFGATVQQLANLHYVQFPQYRPLDTRDGGEDLLVDVEEYDVDLVFLDTVSRYVKGKENDSDTWLDLYRYTLARLKARKVASVRLDHFGKDTDRGSRGSSAKDQDIDSVWELAEQPGELLRLTRTHTRNGHGEDGYVLRRHGEKVAGQWKAGATRHEVQLGDPGPPPAAVEPGEAVMALAAKFDEVGMPRTWGRERVAQRCAELKIATGGNVMLSKAIKYRKVRNDLSANLSADDLDGGQVCGQVSATDRSRTGRTKPQVTPVRDRFMDSSRTGESGPVRVPSPLHRRGQGEGSTQDADSSKIEDAACTAPGCFRPTDLRDPDGKARCDRCTPPGEPTPDAPERPCETCGWIPPDGRIEHEIACIGAAKTDDELAQWYGFTAESIAAVRARWAADRKRAEACDTPGL